MDIFKWSVMNKMRDELINDSIKKNKDDTTSRAKKDNTNRAKKDNTSRAKKDNTSRARNETSRARNETSRAKKNNTNRARNETSRATEKDDVHIDEEEYFDDDELEIIECVQMPTTDDSELMVIINEKADKCPFCPNEELTHGKNGLIECMDCGTICGHVISRGAEWRFYGGDDNKSADPTRCGNVINELLPQSSLGSMISLNSRGNETYEMRKMRECHGWNAMPYRERSLYAVFTTIQLKAHNHGISPCIIEDAKGIFKKIYDAKKISRGDNRNGLIASSISIACKRKGVPRSPAEIAEIFDLNIKKTTRGCKRSDKILQMANKNEGNAIVVEVVSQPNDFISRFCSNLDVSPEGLKLCKYILLKTDEHEIVTDNTPPSIAAGAIFMASVILDSQITKKDISKACKISEVTISKCYKKLDEYKKYIIPSQYLNDEDDEDEEDAEEDVDDSDSSN